ncbi:MAG: hypothetical protein ACM3O4_06415 [Ignavibacteriales bacterium]
MKKGYIWLGLIVIVLGIAGFVGYSMWNNNTFSSVTISINPEVELLLNNEDKVVEVIPINEDADILTSDLDLEGLTIEEASEKLIDSAMETGFLDEYSDENTVVITTVNDDETKRQALQEKIMTKFTSHFEGKKIYPVLVAKGLDDDLKAEADQYGISYGKMLLVESALALNDTLSKDELVNMSIRDIQTEIKTVVKDRRAALKLSRQEAKEELKAKKAELKKNYKTTVENLKATIAEEYKEELKNMTPAQRKEAINNYLTARKEAIKNDIGAIREEIKAEIKEDMEGYNYPVLENNAAAIKESIKERIQNKRGNR